MPFFFTIAIFSIAISALPSRASAILIRAKQLANGNTRAHFTALEHAPKVIANPESLPPISRIVNFRDKIIPWDALTAWRTRLREQKRVLVVTNGCFDLLHTGHVTYLET